MRTKLKHAVKKTYTLKWWFPRVVSLTELYCSNNNTHIHVHT